MLYFSMVNWHLNCGILFWGFAPTCLIKIQKRIMRAITCSKYNAHTEPLFKLMDVFMLKDLLNINAPKLYYKYLHGTPGMEPSLHTSIHSISKRRVRIIPITPTRATEIRTNRTRTLFANNRLKIYPPSITNSVPITLLQKYYSE